MQDKAVQESVIRKSGLQWTLIKPSRLTNGSSHNSLAVGPELKIGMLSSVSRADLAGTILSELIAP